jgi:hypothetical protein
LHKRANPESSGSLFIDNDGEAAIPALLPTEYGRNIEDNKPWRAELNKDPSMTTASIGSPEKVTY